MNFFTYIIFFVVMAVASLSYGMEHSQVPGHWDQIVRFQVSPDEIIELPRREMLAVICLRTNNFAELDKAIKNNILTINSTIGPKREHTLLHCAVLADNADMIDYLINRGAKMYGVSDKHPDVLTYAYDNGVCVDVSLLLTAAYIGSLQLD